MKLDSKLSFDEHSKSVLSKISKTFGLLRKFEGVFPTEAATRSVL